MSAKSRTSLYLLGFTIAALTAMPRARLDVGGAPLYLIDVLALFTLLSTASQPGWSFVGRSKNLLFLVMIFIASIGLSQLNSTMTYGALKESVYIFARYMLAISLIWSTPKIIESLDDFFFVIRMAVIGLIVTSLITIGVSLPPTRGFIANNLLSNAFLEPAAEQTVERLGVLASEDEGTRGRSLVGTSTMTGGFITVLWPLTFILMNAGLLGRFSLWSRIACALGAAGAIMTYGRGAILGLLFGAFAVLLFGEKSTRRNLVLVGLGIAMIIGTLGLDSKMFFFDRLIRKTEVLIEGDFSDDNESGRIKSFTEPIIYLFAKPESIVFGVGNTRGKAGRAVFNYHSTPAAAYHFFGLIGAFAHSGIFLLAFWIVFKESKQKHYSDFMTICFRGMVVVFVATVPWWVLGHAMASVPSGVMLFFFLVGLVAALEKLDFLDRLSHMSDIENEAALMESY